MKGVFTLWKKVLAILSSAVVLIVMGLGIYFFKEPSEKDIVSAREKIEDVFYETDDIQEIFTKTNL